MNWTRFDYFNPPEEGIYWFVASTPGYDIDVDDRGALNGQSTGDTTTSVCMAHLSVDDEGRVQFDPVDRWTFGEIPGEACVSYFALVQPPALMGLKATVLASAGALACAVPPSRVLS